MVDRCWRRLRERRRPAVRKLCHSQQQQHASNSSNSSSSISGQLQPHFVHRMKETVLTLDGCNSYHILLLLLRRIVTVRLDLKLVCVCVYISCLNSLTLLLLLTLIFSCGSSSSSSSLVFYQYKASWLLQGAWKKQPRKLVKKKRE